MRSFLRVWIVASAACLFVWMSAEACRAAEEPNGKAAAERRRTAKQPRAEKSPKRACRWS